MKRMLIGLMMVVFLAVFGRVGDVLAGNLDSTAAPTDDSTRMYTIENIYDYLTGVDNAPPSKATGGFQEPSTGPTAGTMYTLDDVFGNLTRFPATGQTTSYATGDDGDLEKGATKRYQDNADGTVTDLNTGLMWEQKTDDGSIHDKDNTYTWADAFSVFIAGVNSAEFAGYSDWRLPNAYELFSICLLEPTHGAPYIDTTYFPNTVSSYYWSSTTYPFNTGSALAVTFSFGLVYSFSKTSSRYVRAVRGGQ